MIEKKIKSLRDAELKTVFGIHFLSVGEVKVVRFRDQRTFDALVQLGMFVEAGANEPVIKKIPVLLPEVTEEELVAVEPETHHDLVIPNEAPEELQVSEKIPVLLPEVPDAIDDRVEPFNFCEDPTEIPIEEQDESRPELEATEVMEVEEFVSETKTLDEE